MCYIHYKASFKCEYMINFVPDSKNNAHNPYNAFTTKQNGYLLMSKKEVKHIKENSEEGKSHKLAKSVAIGALVVGFGTLALMKGIMPKGLNKRMDKLKIYLEQKIANMKASKSVNKFEEFYIIALRGVESFLNKSQSINNITSWKDVGFQRLMWGKKGNRKFTRNMHEWFTKLFEKIGRNTVLSSYAKTHKRFFKLSQHLEGINEKLLVSKGSAKLISINGEEKTMSLWLERARELTRNINNNLEKGFGQDARMARYREMKQSVSGLFDYFWGKNFKTLKTLGSKDVWQTFIADDYIKADKMKMANKVSKLRQAITHDIIDNYNSTVEALRNIDKFIDPSDKSSREIIRNLRNNLNTYKKLSGNNEVSKRIALNEKIIDDLQKLSGNYAENAPKYKYSEEAVKQVSAYINEVDNIISKSSKGDLQELLTIYKSVLPRAEYLKLRAKVHKVIKSLDKSIDLETVQFYDKIRDLVLGSAPTDVLSILFSAGAIGYGLTKASNKEEKISVTLKSGIPVIAAVGTSLYCSAGLVSGSKAMFVGLLSGLVMNKIGVYVDNLRKKYVHNKQENNTKTLTNTPQVSEFKPVKG